jgi:primosomal protein N' (replication factor Y)
MTEPLFGPTGGDVVRVALPVPVDRLFDYTVPPEFAATAHPGCRVQVRVRERHLTGVIVERVTESAFAGRLRPIERVVDAEPALSEEMIEILRAAADEVLCPVGIALASALPTGSAPRHVEGFAITPRGREALEQGVVGPDARQLLGALSSAPCEARQLARRVGLGRGRALEAALRPLEQDGLVSRIPIERPPSARAATVRMVEVAQGVDVEAVCEGPLARAPGQAALLRRLAKSGATPSAVLSRESNNARSLVRALAARSLVVERDDACPRDVLGTPLELERRVEPTSEQAAALEPIVDAIRERRHETFLLHGVTGSGKTEVYLRAVGAALAEGRRALVLVPEITLTHQILARLRGRFGDDLAVLHSGLRPGERLEQWQRLRDGSTPIAVGARSALFAPIENLGVIVIDEEHDGSYKNEEGFRYHARSLADRRAASASCPVILGSATPSLETRHAADRGVLRRLELAHRVGGRPLPAVEIIDLVREREKSPRGAKIILSRTLRSAMRGTLERGGQTILFLNRRGFSTQILCFECGHAERCPHCDIALVYHATDEVLRCHYCDHQKTPPEGCAECGAPETALLGLGTQRFEEEVRTRFPEARIARLDRDTASRRGATETVLRNLRAGDLDILIGTQMVAKGHDYPGVQLVGVVVADIGLHLPDFRAAERTLQLLTQVAGRAGRDRAPGRVVVQTFVPDHYAIRPVLAHDYEGFYRSELLHREKLGYPPFGELVRALVSGESEEQTMAGAQALAGALAEAGLAPPSPDALEVLGPAPAPLARLRGRHRIQLIVKGSDPKRLRRAAEVLVATANALPEELQASVDRHPIQML